LTRPQSRNFFFSQFYQRAQLPMQLLQRQTEDRLQEILKILSKIFSFFLLFPPKFTAQSEQIVF
jgi:hypothetical protein